MKILSLCLLAAVLCGCGTKKITMTFESQPTGAHVFYGIGANEASATPKSYIGVTPCSWETEIDDDGSFVLPGIPVYSTFVPAVAVFEARPPIGESNLFSQRVVFHGSAFAHPGDKAPLKLFFDMTRPPEPKPETKPKK